MIEGSIFALAFVAGLTVLANAEQKDVEYFDKLSHSSHARMISGTQSFANGLAFDLLYECDNKNDLKFFADRLMKPGSDADTCAVDKLAEADVIISILRRVPQPGTESLLDYLEKIRSHSYSFENKQRIEKLLDEARRLCYSYTSNIHSFLREAEGTEFVHSKSYSRVYAARNACRFYLVNGIAEATITAVGERANAKYKKEIAKIELKEQADEETRRAEKEMSFNSP